jgi:hypothetical protein
MSEIFARGPVKNAKSWGAPDLAMADARREARCFLRLIAQGLLCLNTVFFR